MRLFTVTTLVGLSLGPSLAAEQWPQWRGPRGTGVSAEKALPSRWDPETLAWTARLAGVGVSSPVVWGERIFVTSQLGQAARKPGRHPRLAQTAEGAAEKPLPVAGEGGITFVIEAFDRADGRRA